MRRRAILLAVIAVLVVAGSVGSPTPASAAGTSVPQVVTVRAISSTSTYATVEAWARQADGRYRRVAAFPSARIGAQGMGVASESRSRTPVGTFTLSKPFGIKPNPGVATSYLQVGRDDVWTGSTGSVLNQHRRCAPGTCPPSYGSFERLSRHPGVYDYGVFIGYNAPAPYGTGAVSGAGSAFFVHVKNTQPTAGCVAVSASQMVWLLRWFKPNSTVKISIGVGAAAYAPIPNRYV